MTADPVELAVLTSWIVTVAGLGLWVWSWVGEKRAVKQLRYRDAGLVLVFAAILLRVFVQERAMTWFDWAMIVVGPIFIAAALWRLSRTAKL